MPVTLCLIRSDDGGRVFPALLSEAVQADLGDKVVETYKPRDRHEQGLLTAMHAVGDSSSAGHEGLERLLEFVMEWGRRAENGQFAPAG